MGIGNKVLHSVLKTDGRGVHLDLVKATAPTIPTLKAGETYTGTVLVDIAAAAVATLNATPVACIAAPGANQYTIVNWMSASLVHNGVNYDAAVGNEDLTLKYTNGSGAELVTAIDRSGFGDASADVTRFTRGASDLTVVNNAAVVAHIKSGEWYSAAGDGDLSLLINFTVHSAL